MNSKEMIKSASRSISLFIRWYTHLLNNPSKTTRSLSLAMLVLVAFFSILGIFRITDPYPFRDWIYLRLTLQDMGSLGGIVYILMVAVLSLISPISLFIMTGAASFGPLLGIALSYIGAVLNANLTFFIVKGLSVEKAWGKNRSVTRIRLMIRKNGYPIVLILQFASVIPFVAVNSAAAAAGVKWKDFMKATSVGVVPCIVIYSFLGDSLISNLISPRVYFALITLVVLLIIFASLNRKRNLHQAGKPLS